MLENGVQGTHSIPMSTVITTVCRLPFDFALGLDIVVRARIRFRYEWLGGVDRSELALHRYMNPGRHGYTNHRQGPSRNPLETLHRSEQGPKLRPVERKIRERSPDDTRRGQPQACRPS